MFPLHDGPLNRLGRRAAIERTIAQTVRRDKIRKAEEFTRKAKAAALKLRHAKIAEKRRCQQSTK
jgi:hypothetical protein